MLTQLYMVGIIISSLHMKKLRLREARHIPSSHTACEREKKHPKLTYLDAYSSQGGALSNISVSDPV